MCKTAEYITATARRQAALQAHRKALLAGDTRRQAETAKAVREATHTVLRMEVGR